MRTISLYDIKDMYARPLLQTLLYCHSTKNLVKNLIDRPIAYLHLKNLTLGGSYMGQMYSTIYAGYSFTSLAILNG